MIKKNFIFNKSEGLFKKKLLIIFIFFCFYVPSFGQNNLSLFSSDNSQSTRNLTKVLQSELNLSLGFTPKIINSNNTSGNLIILGLKNTNIKEVNYDGLGEDGFVIKTVKPNQLIISSNSVTGLEFAIYYFLEKELGVKWLMPSSKWTYRPSVLNYKFSNINVIKKPDFITRRMAPINTNENNEIGIWGKHLGLRQDIEYNHSLYKIFGNTQDFAPKVNGKRKLAKSKTDQTWQPNFKASGIENYSSTFLINYFEKNPSVKTFSLGINDSRIFDDGNNSGRKNHFGLKDYSEPYYQWVKKTVEITNKKFPNKKYGLLAYNNVASPPSFSLPDNVVPFITYERLRWVDPKLKALDLQLLNTWKQRVKEIGWYDYTYGASYIVPRPYFATMSNYLNTANSNNVKHYTTELYPNILEGPKPWILSKLLWDVDLNPDQLLLEWCNAAVGEDSSPCLKEFYDLWNIFWTKDVVNSSWWNLQGTAYLQFNNTSYINLIPVGYMEKSDQLLKLALDRTKNNAQKSRMNEIMEIWELAKMNYVYFSKNSLKGLSKSSVTKSLIFQKMNSLSQNPLNEKYVNLLKQYNKY